AVPKPLELLSVHIPKTAGTSFRHTLREVYGEQAVIRLDIPLAGRGKTVRINEIEYTGGHLPVGTTVAHGHFSPALFREKFPDAPEVPLITWLRDPVDRVISNYFYLSKRLHEELQEKQKGLDILRRMECSLMEYAARDVNRDRQHKFLAGVTLDQLAFVAIQEHYGTELQALARHFDWPPIQEVKHNVTGNARPEVTPEMREEIARLNPLDVALYQEGLALRAARIQSA
ncbi:MAG: hypothetical protein WBA17_00635, partial [Saprospiraceae bacterium]